MQNYELIVVILLGVLAFVSVITLIVVIWLLRLINQNLLSFITEFRKNSNIQSKTFDRNFAETNGELKKISYRLDNMSEQLRRVLDFYQNETGGGKTQDRNQKGRM